jgi:hypothetical protein
LVKTVNCRNPVNQKNIMKEIIQHKGQIIAIVITAEFEKAGMEFFTPNDFGQQLAYMNHKEGYVIAPHVHKKATRTVEGTMETIFVKSGKVKVDFYSEQKEYLESRTLKTGDIILLASGGHAFTMLESTEMFEVKQGPYLGENDKEKFS